VNHHRSELSYIPGKKRGSGVVFASSLLRRFLSRSPDPSKRRLDTQGPRRCLCPILLAVGSSTLNASAKRRYLGLRLRLVHIGYPGPRTRNRPLGQQRLALTLDPTPKTRPMPVLGPLDQFRPLRIPLHVAAQLQQMLVRLHRKRLEPALVSWPGPRCVVMGMKTLRVRNRHPAQVLRQFSVAARPED
jgi:hypothetical protein